MAELPSASAGPRLARPGPVSPASHPAEYLEFFERFNAGQPYAAHDVLEPCWLRERGQRDADLFKALIQIAGAFVHLEKGRPDPAARLLVRAASLLAAYPPVTRGLDVAALRERVLRWANEVEAMAPRTGLVV